MSADDTVLVVDDFLATGTTGVALHKIIQQAGAGAAGMAFLVEKRFQDGRGAKKEVRFPKPTARLVFFGPGKILRELPEMSGRIVSLACIESMSEDGSCLNRA